MHQHSINDILDRIETIKKRNEIKDDTPVRFSFGLAPSHVSSWRGSYDLPCIVFSKDAYSMSLSDFVKSLTEAISGEVFTGWKGGEFTYDGNDSNTIRFVPRIVGNLRFRLHGFKSGISEPKP